MYAVIRTGGKQYRVAENDVLFIEKLAAEAGADVEFGEVLAMDTGGGTVLGTPLIAGAKVAGKVLEQKKADKVVIFKKRQRKTYRRMRGHRQQITVVRITGISAP